MGHSVSEGRTDAAPDGQEHQKSCTEVAGAGRCVKALTRVADDMAAGGADEPRTLAASKPSSRCVAALCSWQPPFPGCSDLTASPSRRVLLDPWLSQPASKLGHTLTWHPEPDWNLTARSAPARGPRRLRLSCPRVIAIGGRVLVHAVIIHIIHGG